MSKSRTFKTTVKPAGNSCAIELPFDPKEAFGTVRVPVTATINKAHTFRTTTFRMRGIDFIPFRLSNRQAAGVEPDQKITVTLTLDEKPRAITPPDDLLNAMRAKGAKATWDKLSYTHQREWAESINEAKKSETCTRRITKCLDALTAS